MISPEDRLLQVPRTVDKAGNLSLRLRCDDCVALLRTLNRHWMTSHDLDERKRNECEFCERQFGSQTSLRRHITRIHSKTKVCATCGKKCTSDAAFRRHKASHGNVKPKWEFNCTFCKQGFTNQKALTHHEKRMHASTVKIEENDVIDLESKPDIEKVKLEPVSTPSSVKVEITREESPE